MRHIACHLLSLLLIIAPLAGCSSLRPLPQPILQRDGGTLSAEDTTAAQDLQACRADVRKTARKTIQPPWLPPLGPSGNGVVLGTVHAPHPIWVSSEEYRKAIERCLVGRGYTVHGWQVTGTENTGS